MRITKLTLKNFKSVTEQTYAFGLFDLLVGRNNNGKSTVLQALAIWQFCVDLFHHSKRGGSKGIQVVLPNFSALPLPEFNLLWRNRTDREYPEVDGKKLQKFILIEIIIYWLDRDGIEQKFGIELRYHSPQTIYAIPSNGWDDFRENDARGMPRIAYIPPFSGLEPVEKRLDIAPIRQQVGKGQPGSVLRNLLLSVNATDETGPGRNQASADWRELADKVEAWFAVKLHKPRYDPLKDVYIKVEYEQFGKTYDIIAGGSGFHQTLTLMAFLYGYHPTTILLDEPDAHLHASLQREILDYFKQKSHATGLQFLIATHAEEFVCGVDVSQIVSLLSHEPRRVPSSPEVVRAMSELSNTEVERLLHCTCILYVEGNSDERILRAWSASCQSAGTLEKIYFKTMNGGTKKAMKEHAGQHFKAVSLIIPNLRSLMLFDYDTTDTAFHPEPDNPALMEWQRKNIENYLLVPEAWKRTATQKAGPLFAATHRNLIDAFFAAENLTLPPNITWRNVQANIFRAVDGKRILFENNDSLFHRLRNEDFSVELLRESVAGNMQADEIHQDVHDFFQRLKSP
ncbi:MAG: AAA family ATPase [Magnetococcales bacterium]|nr:AAA family ATPase [Magnetococcales bacterium]